MLKKLFCAALLAATGAARAEAPVRLIIAFPPGGPVDLVGRVLAEQLGKELKQQVIVENKAGANGNIAASYVAKAPGDGSVLFLTSVGAVSISPALYRTCPMIRRATSRRSRGWSTTPPCSWSIRPTWLWMRPISSSARRPTRSRWRWARPASAAFRT